MLKSISVSFAFFFSFLLLFSSIMSVTFFSISSSCSIINPISATDKVGSNFLLMYFDIGFFSLKEQKDKNSLTRFRRIISVWTGLNSGFDDEIELLLLESFDVGTLTEDVDDEEVDKEEVERTSLIAALLNWYNGMMEASTPNDFCEMIFRPYHIYTEGNFLLHQKHLIQTWRPRGLSPEQRSRLDWVWPRVYIEELNFEHIIIPPALCVKINIHFVYWKVEVIWSKANLVTSL